MGLPKRINQLDRPPEKWRPPVFASPDASELQKLIASARRFADLQAASLWNDLKSELPKWSGVIIDVGCGSQPYRELINPNAKYIGIDTADAEAHFGYKVPDTIYFQGTTWPLETASADFVLATETMEHVPDPAVFLAEAHRVLKPGGRLLLSVPFAARYHYIPHDYWRYTPAGLQRLLLAAGFIHPVVYSRGNACTVACYKVMALVLPLLFPQGKSLATSMLLRLCAVPLIPFFASLALIAQISLRWSNGDDCLGYTVFAQA